MATMRPPLPLLCALFAALGCGGSVPHADARFQLELGRLDRAEELLGAARDPSAEHLRGLIRERREHRAEVRARVDAIVARGAELGARRTLEELRALARAESDPVAREWIDAAASRMRDRSAASAASRPLPKGELPGPSRDELDERAAQALLVEERAPAGPRATPPEPQPVDPILALVLEDIARARDAGRWRYALQMIELALPDAPDPRQLEALRAEVLAVSFAEAEDVLREVDFAERTAGLRAAALFLDRERAAFPESEAKALLDRAAAAFAERLVARVEPDPSAPPAATSRAARESAAPAELAARAGALAEQGELAAARDLLESALALARPGAAREVLAARAYALGQRIDLRTALARAEAADPAPFAAQGISHVDARGASIEGAAVAWDRVPVQTLRRLAEACELGERARVGCVLEGLARGEERGLEELAGLVEEGLVGRREAFGLLAHLRGEELPEGGYRFVAGAWVSAPELDRQRVAGEAAALSRELVRASEDERDALLERFLALVDENPHLVAEVADAVEARWERAAAFLTKGATLRQLEHLAEVRADLDAAREHALELIFDEETYFYPYTNPPVPSDKASLYPGVQREVEKRVGAVRELWDHGRRVAFPRQFRAALRELAWASSYQGELGLELELFPGIPDFIDGVDPARDSADLRSFAWDAAERRALAYDRAVRARNAELWKAAQAKPERVASVAERDQVRITNDYRALLGRRALAWNPLVQEAAKGHSSYMADTGRFGHFEEAAERRTPYARMLLAGYAGGVSENCAAGSAGAEAAHAQWLRSSGHHRNILSPGHREMASGSAGSYWTQNFGVGTQFEEELGAWLD